MQRVLPLPARELTIEEAYGDPRPPGPDGRPWIALCMIASIDGSTVLHGASGGLGNANDRQVLLTLRRFADVILVGAATVRAEDYGVPKKPGQRIGVVTRSGRVDPDIELFRSGAGFLVMPEDAPDSPIESVRAGIGELDLAQAVRRLPGDPQVVQVEGGATLNGALSAADLLDELNLTVSPKLIGGDGNRVTATDASFDARFDLTQLCVDDDGYVFSRYRRRR